MSEEKPQTTPAHMRDLVVAKKEAIWFGKQELEKVCSEATFVASHLRHVYNPSG